MLRNEASRIAMSLALLTGALLVGGGALAQATKTPVSGLSGIAYAVIDPGEVWTDEEGVWHARDRRSRQLYRGDVDGRQLRVASLNVDLANGEADFHGSLSFTGSVFGQEVTAVGRFAALCSEWLCEETSVWFLSDGRKINLLEVYPLGAVEPGEYEGILLDAPRRGTSRQNR